MTTISKAKVKYNGNYKLAQDEVWGVMQKDNTNMACCEIDEFGNINVVVLEVVDVEAVKELNEDQKYFLEVL